MIDETLLAQSVKGQESQVTKLRLAAQTRSTTARQAVEDITGQDISDEQLQAEYKTRFIDNAPTEYNAAHILVATEDEAKGIIQELADGADFAELAKDRSTGPSGSNGGDLGWFAEGAMVEPFFNAVLELSPNMFSEAPVETQFGWHIILLKETRTPEPPAFEDVQVELSDGIRRQALQVRIDGLRAEMAVDTSGADSIDPSVIKTMQIPEN